MPSSARSRLASLALAGLLLAGCDLVPQPRQGQDDTRPRPAPAPGSTAGTNRPTAAQPALPPLTISAEQAKTEVSSRLSLLRDWLTRTQRGGVLLTDPLNQSWLTLGRTVSGHTGRPGAALAVLRNQVLVVGPDDTILDARAALPGLDWPGRTYRWDLAQDRAAPVRALQPLLAGAALAADAPLAGADDASAELRQLRRKLIGPEIDRFAKLIRLANQVVEVNLHTAEAANGVPSADPLRAELSRVGLDLGQLTVADASDATRSLTFSTSPASSLQQYVVRVLTGLGGRQALLAFRGQTASAQQATPERDRWQPDQPQPLDPSHPAFQAQACQEALRAALVAAKLGGPLADVVRAGEQALAQAMPTRPVGAGFQAGLGSVVPLDLALSAQSSEKLEPGDVLTLVARLPRGYATATVWVAADGKLMRLSSAGGPEVLPDIPPAPAPTDQPAAPEPATPTSTVPKPPAPAAPAASGTAPEAGAPTSPAAASPTPPASAPTATP